MPSPGAIRDQLWTTWLPENIRRSAFKCINRMQDRPHEQIVGTAIALLAMCEAAGVDMRRVIEAAERHLNDVESPFNSTIKAIREYARNEITRSYGL
jgi:hypothetical protein